MLNFLSKNWWVVLIRGICAVLFGILAFTWPGLTLLTLVLLYGAYALADGVTAIALSFARRGGQRSWWPMIILGALGIIAGVLTFIWPGITAVVLLVIIGCWAIVHGIFQIVAAVHLRKAIEHEWLLGLSGAVSIVFGVIMLMRPGVGALALVWAIGSWALVFGVLMIALSIRLYGMRRRLRAAEEEHPGPEPRPAGT